MSEETEIIHALNRTTAQWHAEADQYIRQVEEARSKGLPHDQMLSFAVALRQCAAGIEALIKKQTNP